MSFSFIINYRFLCIITYLFLLSLPLTRLPCHADCHIAIVISIAISHFDILYIYLHILIIFLYIITFDFSYFYYISIYYFDALLYLHFFSFHDADICYCCFIDYYFHADYLLISFSHIYLYYFDYFHFDAINISWFSIYIIFFLIFIFITPPPCFTAIISFIMMMMLWLLTPQQQCFIFIYDATPLFRRWYLRRYFMPWCLLFLHVFIAFIDFHFSIDFHCHWFWGWLLRCHFDADDDIDAILAFISHFYCLRWLHCLRWCHYAAHYAMMLCSRHYAISYSSHAAARHDADAYYVSARQEYW